MCTPRSPCTRRAATPVYAGAFTSDGGRGATDVSLVTWGQVIGTTDAFWTRQVEEAYIVIWPEHLGTKGFPGGDRRGRAGA